MTALSRAIIKQLSTHHVLYFDRGIVVLNKPAGLVCQKQARTNAFDTHLNEIQRILGQDGPLYPLHRLDKGTTGALVLARTLPLARELSRQFQSKTLRKSYLALVDTTKAKLFHKRGTLRMPLSIEDGRVSVSLNSKGKDAVTEYEVLAKAPNAPVSLLRLNLITGLKHQLRVHLAQGLQAPIRGDSFYKRSNEQSYIDAKHPGHLYLHASQVTMTRYRRVGTPKKFVLQLCAPLPPLFVTECDALGLGQSLSLAHVLGGVHMNGSQVENNSVPELDGVWVSTE